MKKETRKYSDRRKYLIKAVKKRRKLLRAKAITFKGGCCEICVYSKCPDALEFHHINNQNKDFGISAKGYTRSWEKVKNELKKCKSLCANCHREIHSKLISK